MGSPGRLACVGRREDGATSRIIIRLALALLSLLFKQTLLLLEVLGLKFLLPLEALRSLAVELRAINRCSAEWIDTGRLGRSDRGS